MVNKLVAIITFFSLNGFPRKNNRDKKSKISLRQKAANNNKLTRIKGKNLVFQILELSKKK